MPLIHTKAAAGKAGQEDELIEELARELVAEANADQPVVQPFILEQTMRASNALHVAVVWEKWRLIHAGGRGSVIMKAYEIAAKDRVDLITIAMGVTTEEAIDLGLLPYGIETTVRKDGDVTVEQIRTWMKEEGAMATPSGLLLRLPNCELAKSAYDRLVRKSSPNHWALVQTDLPDG